MRPTVLVPTYQLAAGRIEGWTGGGAFAPEAYLRALDRAGVRSLLLPPPLDDRPEELLDLAAGLLVIGGGDVNPARYGHETHPRTYGVDDERDEAELALVRAALDRGIPTLAVCRGLQVLNVACGGSLVQHLPDQAGLLDHGSPVGDGPAPHEVTAEAGSRLAKVCGERIERCTSHHHQAVDRVGDGLAVVARSADGVIEALEPAGDASGWLLAVQWHPEATAADDPIQQSLFDALAAQL